MTVGGIINDLWLTFIIQNGAIPVFIICPPKRIYRFFEWVMSKFSSYDQDKMNKIYEKLPFDLGQAHSEMLWGIATAFFFQRVFPASSYFALALSISCFYCQKIRLAKLSKRPNYHTEDVGRSSLFVLNMMPGVYGAGLMVWDNCMINKIDPLTWVFCAYGLIIIFYPPYVQITKWRAFQRLVRKILKLGECEFNDFSKRSLRDYFIKSRTEEARKVWTYNLGQGPIQLYQLFKKLEELKNNIHFAVTSKPAPSPAQGGTAPALPGAQSVGQNSGIQTPANEPVSGNLAARSAPAKPSTAKFSQGEIKKFRKDKKAVEMQIRDILTELKKNVDRFKELQPYERFAPTKPSDSVSKQSKGSEADIKLLPTVRLFDQDAYLLETGQMKKRDPQTQADGSIGTKEGVIGDFGDRASQIKHGGQKAEKVFDIVWNSRLRLWKQIRFSYEITLNKMNSILSQSEGDSLFSAEALLTRFDDLVHDFNEIPAENKHNDSKTLSLELDSKEIEVAVQKRTGANAKNPFQARYAASVTTSDSGNKAGAVSHYFDYFAQDFDVLYEVPLEKKELQKSTYTDGAYAHYMDFEKPLVPFSEMRKHFVMSYERVNPVSADEANCSYLRERASKFPITQSTGAKTSLSKKASSMKLSRTKIRKCTV